MGRRSNWDLSIAVSCLALWAGLVALLLVSPTPTALSVALGAAAAPAASSLAAGEPLAYEVRAFLSGLTHALTPRLPTPSSLFNPGADLDFTTTTDFEDLAGPAADVLEFGDQDRALLVDSFSATAFTSGLLGGAAGLTVHMILSSDHFRLF